MKRGWIIRQVYVAECGNCADWSRPENSAEAAEHSEHMREVDGVAMCLPCAEAIEAERPKVRRCETCNAECDALGHCLGTCQGEEWDR